MAFALVIPTNVHASSDPSWYDSSPTSHNIVTLTVNNPTNAYDGAIGTFAAINKLAAVGRFEVIDFETGTQTSNDVIVMVDLYMRYDVSGGGKYEYKIWYYVDATYQVSPGSSKTLVDWTNVGHDEATEVWTDVFEPNDGTWTWTDIENLRFVVSSGNPGTGGTKVFEEYEVWAEIFYINEPTLYVDPTSTTGLAVDSVFSVDINITDFAAGNWSGGVYGWEFKLGYDNTLLNGSLTTGVTEGTYLSSAGSTYFNVLNFSDALGLVWITCTLTYDVHGQNGTGVLATIPFKVKAAGSGTLDLYGTKLAGYDYPHKRIYSIPHTAVDGSFQAAGAVPEFPFGAALEIALAVVIVYAWWTRRRKNKFVNSPQHVHISKA